MKKLFTTALVVMLPLLMLAQGWPANYDGVMLQGFYWDSFNESRWPKLESQADEMAEFFKLVWVPQSGNCGGTSMGYDDLYWFTNYNSSFGNESQLRSMINTFKSKGIGTIADVVVNHRKSNNGWFGFPKETYKGVTYSMSSTDVCSTDDGGKAKAEADRLGVQLGNPDTGEDWDGMRDLDHRSTNVQNVVKAYLKMLLDDLGYAGFRYDMTKGYAASYTGMYNSYSAPEFSVGEYWDGYLPSVKGWIDGTKVNGVVQSAAFDFPFRYTIRDAVNNNQWTNLAGSGKGLCLETNYKRYAVTFVENHDTQYRDANNQNDPIRSNIEAANAYMLAMPGTPCVFLKHWLTYKESIKQMIYARQLAGITNTSSTYQVANNSSSNYYVRYTAGSRGTLLAAMGSTAYNISSSYVVVASGTNYRLALSKSTETAWASKPSGYYVDPFNVTLTAVSATADAQIVYTLDGTEPTATNGIVIASGAAVTINKCLTLKAGLLKNGTVSGVITRNYTVQNEVYDAFEVTVFLKDPTASPNNWPQVAFYCWDSNNVQQCGNWPGTVVTDTRVINGVKFYYKTFMVTGSQYTLNFVFSQGGSTAGSHQTVDVTGVRETAFFEVTTQTNKYQVRDITAEYLPYLNVTTGDVNGDGRVTIKDVTDLISYLLSDDDTSVNLAAADVNGIGGITIADVSALINLLLAGN
jgi:alpha-amylase